MTLFLLGTVIGVLMGQLSETGEYKCRTGSRNRTNGTMTDLNCIRKVLEVSWTISAKVRNNRVRTTNGNRGKALNIMHWNMAHAQWQNKTPEIRQAAIEFQPDMFAITEANLLQNIPEHEKYIQGYDRIQPLTMTRQGHCRIIVLVKEGVEVEIMDYIMEDDLATVWLKIRRQGKKNLIVGAIYREFRQLQPLQTQPNLIGCPLLQAARWERIIQQWIKASKLGEAVVTGDLNLDHMKWDNQIETRGFKQVIEGHTRSWQGQTDSRLDHVWTDIPGAILSTRNVARTYSDHNFVCVNMRLKGQEQPNCVQMRRNWKNFSLSNYREKLKNLNWGDYYQIQDINAACLWLESRVQETLNSECPVGTVQTNKKHKSWISTETAEFFKIRDRCKAIA